MKSTIVFYNTENFFDTHHDSNKIDHEYSPAGSRKWTRERYENKVWKISGLLSEIGKAQTGEPPILIGLAEIENKTVLNDLIQNDYLKQYHYQYIHFESLDERGIDNAILFRNDKIKLVAAEPLRYTFPYLAEIPDDFTRDVVYAQFQLNHHQIHLMVLHLPSRREDDLNREFRNLILKKINLKVEEIKKIEENPKIIIMGDFNGNPNDADAKLILKTNKSQEINQDELYNPMMEMMYKSGSLKHKGKWILFDQILFSKAFLENRENGISVEEVQIYNDHSIRDWDRKFKGSPFRTFAGKKYLGGYSDHFPVYTILNY